MSNLSFKNYIKADPEDLSEPERNSPEINKQFNKICEEISKQSDVETIDLSGNTLSEYQLAQLAIVLEPHKKLLILDLEYNRIGLASIPFLKKIIKDHPFLTDISLDYNEMDDKALEALLTDESPEYLHKIKNIQFRFYDNKITEKGLDFSFDKVSLDTLETAVSFNKVKQALEDQYYKRIEEERNLLIKKPSSLLLYSESTLKKDPMDEEVKSPESKSTPASTNV